ncbi:MAG: hypothetical protein ACWGQW_00760 [bacterium]
MVKVIGADLSLNHGAIIQLNDGQLADFWYYTDLAGSAGKSKKRGHRMPTWSKIKDRQVKQMARLAWIENFLDKTVLMKALPDYAGIEDYALDVGHGAHYQGEVGGIARILCWFRGISMRLHDPVSLKMFASHRGTADKDFMEEQVCERWSVDFSSLNQPLSSPTKKTPNPKQNRQTSQDLADAYALAQLVWTEVQLRAGTLTLAELHEKEVRVFNRVTKSYPVSLLDRDWIVNPDGTPTPHGDPVCVRCGSRKCCLARDGER